jgi:hypothetical protein
MQIFNIDTNIHQNKMVFTPKPVGRVCWTKDITYIYVTTPAKDVGMLEWCEILAQSRDVNK